MTCSLIVAQCNFRLSTDKTTKSVSRVGSVQMSASNIANPGVCLDEFCRQNLEEN